MRSSEEENQIWDQMVRKYGVYELARKIARREPYRKYVSRWPFDHTESRLSLDLLAEVGFDPPTEEDIEFEFASEEMVQTFLMSLTPKQRKVTQDLMLGFPPKELYKGYNYKSTGGVRYHKWVLRKKWKEFIKMKSNEYKEGV